MKTTGQKKISLSTFILLLFILLNISCVSKKSPPKDSNNNSTINEIVFTNLPNKFAITGLEYKYAPVPKTDLAVLDYKITSVTTSPDQVENLITSDHQFTWTPSDVLAGKSITFTLTMEAQDRSPLIHEWKVDISNKFPISPGSITQAGLEFKDLDNFTGYNLKLPSSEKFVGTQVNLSFSTADLTEGYFKNTIQSSAYFLEFSNVPTTAPKSTIVDIKIDTSKIENIAAPIGDEIYFLVLSEPGSSSPQNSAVDNGVQVIPLVETNGVLGAIFNIQINSLGDNANPLIGLQLVKSKALKIEKDNGSLSLYWLFTDPADSDSQDIKDKVKAHLDEIYATMSLAKQKYQSMKCDTTKPVKVIVHPYIRSFANIYYTDIATESFESFISLKTPCRDGQANVLCAQSDMTPAMEEFNSTIAHEFFHTVQFYNSGMIHISSYDAANWLVESSASYASNLVFPSDLYLEPKVIYNSNYIRLGLAGKNIDGTEKYPALARHRYYMQALFFEFIRKKTENSSNDLNLCSFIADPVYKKTSISAYSAGTLDGNTLYQPLDLWLDGNRDLTVLKKSFVEFIHAYTYQDIITFPEMDRLMTESFIPSQMTVKNQMVNSFDLVDVIGGEALEIVSDVADELEVKLESFIEDKDGNTVAGGDFFAELYSMPLDATGEIIPNEKTLLATFDPENLSHKINFRTDLIYSLVVIQSDFSKHLANEGLKFNVKIMGGFKPILYAKLNTIQLGSLWDYPARKESEQKWISYYAPPSIITLSIIKGKYNLLLQNGEPDVNGPISTDFSNFSYNERRYTMNHDRPVKFPGVYSDYTGVGVIPDTTSFYNFTINYNPSVQPPLNFFDPLDEVYNSPYINIQETTQLDIDSDFRIMGPHRRQNINLKYTENVDGVYETKTARFDVEYFVHTLNSIGGCEETSSTPLYCDYIGANDPPYLGVPNNEYIQIALDRATNGTLDPAIWVPGKSVFSQSTTFQLTSHPGSTVHMQILGVITGGPYK